MSYGCLSDDYMYEGSGSNIRRLASSVEAWGSEGFGDKVVCSGSLVFGVAIGGFGRAYDIVLIDEFRLLYTYVALKTGLYSFTDD